MAAVCPPRLAMAQLALCMALSAGALCQQPDSSSTRLVKPWTPAAKLVGIDPAAEQAPAPALAKPVRVLRFRNQASGLHTFAAIAPKAAPAFAEYREEGMENPSSDSPFFYLYPRKIGDAVALYAFQDAHGSLVLAANETERQQLAKQGLSEQSQPFYVYPHPVEGASELFRLRNRASGDLVYTTSLAEREFYLARGWLQLASLGYTQASSSTGTGTLRETTVKLTAAELALVSKHDEAGAAIEFTARNDTVTAIHTGSVLYAERSQTFPLGLVRRVIRCTRTESGKLLVETRRAGLMDALEDLHLFISGAHLLFPKGKSAPVSPAASAEKAGQDPFFAGRDQQISAKLEPEYQAAVKGKVDTSDPYASTYVPLLIFPRESPRALASRRSPRAPTRL